MNTFEVESAFPPSLAGMPLVTMAVVIGFWAGALLCLQWIYSIIDDAIDNPAAASHPLNNLRKVKVMILIAVIAPVLPRGILLMAWQKLSPAWREGFALSSWAVFVPCALLLGYAWWIDRQIRPMERRAVSMFRSSQTHPPARAEKTRGILILVLIFVVAFATTFVRPDPDAHRAPPIVQPG